MYTFVHRVLVRSTHRTRNPVRSIMSNIQKVHSFPQGDILVRSNSVASGGLNTRRPRGDINLSLVIFRSTSGV